MENVKSGAHFDKEALLDDLLKILDDMTSDWEMGFSGSIGPETRLMADLGFASVDVVQLAVAIEEHFSRQNLPFQKLVLKPDGRYVDDLTVNELVDFLNLALNNTDPR